MALIEVRELSKRYGGGAGSGGILAVDRVSFRVEAGEVVGFLGPNGAGKSTTMKMITGFLAPTGGSVSVGGHDVVAKTIAAQRMMGYLPEGAPAYPDMTPAGFLKFVSDARGIRGSKAKEAIERAVARTNLLGVLHQPIDTLSKGFKRRVGLAQAVLHDPDVLIMDEPTDGLDPNQKHEVRQLIRAMARPAASEGGKAGGKAIVLSTHILEEVEAVCTRVIVIARGRVVADCTPQQLLAKSKYHRAVSVTLRHVPAGARVREDLMGLPGVRDVERIGTSGEAAVAEGGGGAWTVFPSRGESDGEGLAARVVRACDQKGYVVDRVRVEEGRMDEVFRELTA